jgi:low affinity Fe/Cu permease
MNEFFDRFADGVADVVAHAGFFIFCVLLVVVWVPSILLIRNVDTWQLIINTATTIITFLLVALLQNTQARFEKATNARLECIEEELGVDDPVVDDGQKEKRNG